MKNWIFKYIFCIEVIILLLLSFTPFLWFKENIIVLGHDSGFRLNFFDYFQHLWYGWNPTVNFGTNISIYKGFLILELPGLLLIHLLGSLERAQPWIFSFWFFIMGLGMYIGMRGFFPDKRYWFLRLYTSIFWVYNFFILQAWFIAERAKFSVFAALPIGLYLLVSTFTKRMPLLRGSALFGLLYFLLNGGGSVPIFGATFLVFFIASVYYGRLAILQEGKKGLIWIGKVISLFTLSFVVCNAYWLVIQIDFFRRTYETAVNTRGGIEGLIAWEQEVSKYASFGNLLRLQGIPDWYANPVHAFSSLYSSQPLFIVVSFLPVLVISLGIILLFKKRRLFPDRYNIVLFFVLLIPFGLFFAAGSHPPTGRLYVLFMEYIPGFAIFRSSFYKFAPALFLSFIVLSGYFLSIFFERFRMKGIYKFFLKCLILGGILLYHFPYFMPAFFQFEKGFTTRLSIPSYVTEMGEYISKNVSVRSRILLVPEQQWGHALDKYTWGFLSFDYLPRVLVNRSFIGSDNNEKKNLRVLYENLQEGNIESVKKLAAIFGINYILVRDDAVTSPEIMSAYGTHNYSSFISNLVGPPVYKNGPWYLFSLDITVPFIETLTEYSGYIGGAKHQAYILKELEATQAGVITLDSLSYPSIKDFVIEAKCILCSPKQYKELLQSVERPRSNFWMLVMIKRLGMYLLQKGDRAFVNEDKKVDYLLDQAQQRIQEWKDLIGKADTRTLDLFLPPELSYVELMGEVEKRVEGMSEREKLVYSVRLLSFLEAQQKEIETISSDRQEFIEARHFAEKLMNRVSLYTPDVSSSSVSFQVDVPQDGEYALLVLGEDTPVGKIVLNGQELLSLKKHFFPRGRYRIEYQRNGIVNTSRKRPVLFLKHSEPVLKELAPRFEVISEKPDEVLLSIGSNSLPYLLMMREQYDLSWIAEQQKDGKWKPLIVHREVNGFANGWIIEPSSESKIRIFNQTHRLFILGMILTTVGVVGVMITLILSWRKRETT